MAARFVCSFDHFPSTKVSRKWTSAPVGSSVAIVPGRHDNGIQIAGGTFVFVTLGPQPQWYVGLAWVTNALGVQGFCRLGRLGMISVDDGRVAIEWDGVAIATSDDPFLETGNYHYLELGYDVSGDAVFRVDGDVAVTATGIDTDGHEPTGVKLSGAGGGASSVIDDLYLNDGTGDENNGFFGDVEIRAILPDEDDSTYHEWAPTGGVAEDLPQYTEVDENPDDDDTTLIYSKDIGKISLFGFPTLTFDGTVKGAQLSALCRKNDVGIRAIRPVARSGGANYFGQRRFLSTDWLYKRQMYNVDPSTGELWTVSGINAAKFGVELADPS